MKFPIKLFIRRRLFNAFVKSFSSRSLREFLSVITADKARVISYQLAGSVFLNGILCSYRQLSLLIFLINHCRLSFDSTSNQISLFCITFQVIRRSLLNQFFLCMSLSLQPTIEYSSFCILLRSRMFIITRLENSPNILISFIIISHVPSSMC